MKKPLSVKEFAKNNWILIGVLALVFVVSLTVFIIVFWDKLYDVGAWGSLVAGIFTYLGSTFLGVVVFYNTQFQQRQKEIEDQIIVYIKQSSDYDHNDEHYIPYTYEKIEKEQFKFNYFRFGKAPISIDFNESGKDARYLRFSVTNRNTHIPIFVQPKSMYFIDFEGRVQTIDSFYYFTDSHDNEPLDYRQTKVSFIGTNNSLLDIDYYKNGKKNLVCYVLISLKSISNAKLYALFRYDLSDSFTVATPKFLSEEDYKNSTEKYGYPVSNDDRKADFEIIIHGDEVYY